MVDGLLRANAVDVAERGRREQISVPLSFLATKGYVDQDGARSIRLAELAVCNNSMIFSSLNWEGDP
jgi:hypothetical protein